VTAIFESQDGLSLAYRDEGQGLPLLCLAGLTRTMADFDYLAPHLPPLRLIRMDYRGRGASDWADPATYTVAQEAADALALLDRLGVEKAAVLGTSRGGLIAMLLAATAKDRLAGVCLNDVGPEIAPAGLAFIRGYIGRAPAQTTLDAAAAARARAMTGFQDVPMTRWRDEVARFFVETPDGLALNYDPRLAEAFADTTADAPPPDLWPLFDALAGLPLAALRGANSDLLTPETFAEMRRRCPDMIATEVPGRGHVPFLDEPEALDTIRAWLGRCR